MKKFISIAITLSLLTALMTSCGGKSSTESAETTTTVSEQTVELPEETTVQETTTVTPTVTSKETAASTTGSTSKSTSVRSTTAQLARQSTTKKSTTAAAVASTKYSVSPSSVPNPIGKILQAWKLGGNGVNITISRIEYGNKVTQYFSNQSLYKKDSGQIVNPESVTFQPVCSIAVVEGSASSLKISRGNESSKTSTESLANSVGALLAINGHTDSYYTNQAAVIRNGSLYMQCQGEARGKRMVLYKDGTWKNMVLSNETARAEIAKGAYNSIKYQKVLIENGRVNTTENDPFSRSYAYVGRISSNKFVLMTTEFMPSLDVISVLRAYGCTDAVRVQGGNCTQMFVRGIGNTTGSNGASIKGLNKVGKLETELFSEWGLLAPKKGGGPCYSEIDIFYF